MFENFRHLLLLGLFFITNHVGAEKILSANTVISIGQSVYSDNGQYFLVMQTDGNLVMYRNDGIVRFATYKAGNYAVMQGDGNFVQYTSANQAVWHTATHGNPGAALAIQNDGNLVVYLAGKPLWSIGSDNTGGNPSYAGDVIGRNMDLPALGSFGHLGVWTGGKVAEVGPYGNNAIRYSSLSDFKAAGLYWGAASPRIPNYPVYACFQLRCPNLAILANGYEVTSTRMAIAKRVYQAYITGADYTVQASWISAGPTWNTSGSLARGLYRCDTFVLDMLGITVYNSNAAFRASVDTTWKERYDRLVNGARTPTIIYNTLKSYQ